jgi:hypothetical protein
MEFKFNGDNYEIEFSRNRRAKNTTDKGLPPSRLTTVRIIKSQPDKLPGEIYREASSACSVLDPFNAEKGRLAALRVITPTLSKGFRAAMWNAYINRKPKPKSKTPSNVIPFPIA